MNDYKRLQNAMKTLLTGLQYVKSWSSLTNNLNWVSFKKQNFIDGKPWSWVTSNFKAKIKQAYKTITVIVKIIVFTQWKEKPKLELVARAFFLALLENYGDF